MSFLQPVMCKLPCAQFFTDLKMYVCICVYMCVYIYMYICVYICICAYFLCSRDRLGLLNVLIF